MAENGNKDGIHDSRDNLHDGIQCLDQELIKSYNMNNKNRGLAIIFNHVEFDVPNSKREGSFNDVDELHKSLKHLGFKEIYTKENLKVDEIFDFIQNIKEEEKNLLKESDCIAIFVLTHGKPGNLVYARDGSYDLYKLVEQFMPKQFKEFAGKPKLFFISACRGSEINNPQQVLYLAEVDGENKIANKKNKIDTTIASNPIIPDVLVCLSAFNNHYSLRRAGGPETGTIYIQELCKSINYYKDNLSTTDIYEIIMRAHFELSKKYANVKLNENYEQIMQTPCYISGLSRKLFFTPKSKIVDY